MKRSRFREEEIVRILGEHRGGRTAKEICAEHNISQQTFYNWKRKYGEMDVGEARRLRGLEDENAGLKRLVAELSMQNDILKEVNTKKW